MTLDARLASLAEDRRAALERGLDARRVRADIAAWLAAEGPDAGLVVLARCLARARAIAADQMTRANCREVVELFEIYLDVLSERDEAPALAVEIIASLPRHHVAIAHAMLARSRRLRERIHEPMRADLRRPVNPQTATHRELARRIFAQRLASDRALGHDIALAGLSDPVIRVSAEAALEARAVDHAPRLRELLAVSPPPSPETRAAILRLLRKSDPSLDLEGRSPETPLEKLEAQLRIDPTNAHASQVWADALTERGDPRGTLITLEHALRVAEPEHALEIAAEQNATWSTHRAALRGKSGGFPFREIYHGRELISYEGRQNARTVAARSGGPFARIQRFVALVTDVAGPETVDLRVITSAALHLDPSDPVATPESDLEKELVELLAPATLRTHDARRYVRRDRLDAPLADAAALESFFVRNMCTIAYRFRFARPGTKTLFPHQAPESYDATIPGWPSRVHATTPNGHVVLRLFFPFEDPGDPGFRAVVLAMKSTLGKSVFSRNAFGVLAPGPYGMRTSTRSPSFLA